MTLGLYLRTTSFHFTDYDDYDYVAANPRVQAGLTWPGVVWALTTPYSSNWHPLTWLSHMLDCQIYGLRPGGHHLTNIILHAFNTVLLFFVLLKMTGATWRSCIVAALFAWHPVHVESVAWIAERKDVLSTLFGLLTLLAYSFYAGATNGKRPVQYCLALLCFALSLLSKPMLVTLPFVLLLLDYWPLGRFQLVAEAKAGNTQPAGLPIGWLVMEKIPFFVLAAISCCITYVVQARSGAVASLIRVPILQRLANAPIAYVRYIGKLLWPENLCVFYPLQDQFPIWQVAGAILFLVVVTGAVFVAARRLPWLMVGWAWFLGTLVPVIGLVQVGAQAMADRYTYIPSIGFFIVIVWGAAMLASHWNIPQKSLAIATVCVLVLSCFCTSVQLGYWESSTRLFQHAVDVTTNNVFANIYLGDALIREGNYEKGIARLEDASKMAPGYANLQGRIGMALSTHGRVREGIEHYRIALELDPNMIEVLNNLAWLLATSQDAQLRNGAEAVRLADRACELTHYEMANVIGTAAAGYAEAGQFKEAVALGEKARQVALDSGNGALAQSNLKLVKLYRANQPYHETANIQ